jgi:NAD(P)-dependent dehydrogenase (short-subunit alcohol dehydrogenase family)
MIATIPPFMLNNLQEQIPLHRMGQPDEIARVVRFLAEDASSYITGQIWGVNGGIDM